MRRWRTTSAKASRQRLIERAGRNTDSEGLLRIAADVVVALVALLHVYFLVLEMFLWDTACGRRIFVWVQAVPAAIALGLVLAS